MNQYLLEVQIPQDSNSTAAAEERKRQRLERRLRRRAVSTSQPLHEPKPVAIIDLERSPFREITPEAVNVIVVSDGDKSPDERRFVVFMFLGRLQSFWMIFFNPLSARVN